METNTFEDDFDTNSFSLLSWEEEDDALEQMGNKPTGSPSVSSSSLSKSVRIENSNEGKEEEEEEEVEEISTNILPTVYFSTESGMLTTSDSKSISVTSDLQMPLSEGMFNQSGIQIKGRRK